MDNECKCSSCQGACRFKPGWFKPGEVEKVAEFLGLSVQELFEQKLGVDYWVSSVDGDTFVLAPATRSMLPGQEYPFHPNGECVFFDAASGLCTIHPVKPFECREYNHDDTREMAQARHQEAAEAWRGEQEQITQLLGHEPEVEEPDIFSGVRMMVSLLGGANGV